MSEFWSYEDKRTYDKRLASLFEVEARKYLWGDDSGETPSSAFDAKLLSSDMDAIQPKPQPQKGGSFLGQALGVVDDISSKMFGGEVRQPWDVLRPIARVFEAENKYIAQPLARGAFEGLGVNYDELPGVARFGLEAAFSPSSWVGVGLVGKGAKALKVLPGLERFATTDKLGEYLIKSGLPNIVGSSAAGLAEDVGLPPWAGLPVGLLSAKGTDFYYGQFGDVKKKPVGTRFSIIKSDGESIFSGQRNDPNRLLGPYEPDFGPLQREGDVGPSTQYRHAPAYDEGGFTGIFFTTDPRSFETEQWGAGATNTPVRAYDLEALEPGKSMGNSDARANINKLTEPDSWDRKQIELMHDMMSRGEEVAPNTVRKPSSQYSVYDSDAPGPRKLAYFDTAQEAADYANEPVRVEKYSYSYQGRIPYEGPRWGKPDAPENSRVYPAIIKPGTKLWNPHMDPHPEVFKKELEVNQQLQRNLVTDADKTHQATTPVFDSHTFSRSQRRQLQEELTAQGYSGFETRHELLIWDDDAIVPLYEARGQEWTTSQAWRKATQKHPGLALSVPALAKAFPAAGSARAIGLGIMGDSDFDRRVDEILNKPMDVPAADLDQGAAIGNIYKTEAGKSNVPSLKGLSELQSLDEINEGIRQFKEVEQSFANSSSPEALRRGIALAEDTIDQIDEALKSDITPAARVNNNRLREIQVEARDRWAKALMEKTERPSGPDWSRGPRMKVSGEGDLNPDWLKQWQDSLDLSRDPEKFKAAQAENVRKVAEDYQKRADQAAKKFRGKATGGPGTMRAQPEAFAEQTAAIFDSGVPDIFGWRSTEDALTHALQNRSFTQWFRDKVADYIPQKWVDSLESKGVRLRDDELSYLIRAHAEKLQQRDTYGAMMGDLQQSLINKQIVANRDININGVKETVISDPAMIASARALEAQRPGLKLFDAGDRLLFDDFMDHYKVLDMTPEQRAWAQSIDELGKSFKDLEKVMKLNIPDTVTPDGMGVHRQPVSRPVSVTDPRSLQEYKVKIDEGPVLRSRYGATQTAGKPRQVMTKAEGLDAGIKYLPFVEAQRARILQGWTTMADDWLERATSDIGRKPKQLLDPAVVSALDDQIDLRRQANWLEAQLKASIARPMKNSFNAPRFAIRPEVKDMIEQAMWTGANSKQDQRLAGWRAVRERLINDRQPWDSSYELLSKTRKDQLKSIQAYGTEEFPVDFRGQRYPLREGRQLAQLTKVPGEGIAERTLGAFNKNVRPLMATLDASFMGIQGLIALAVDPIAWFSAFKHGVMGDFDAYLNKAHGDGLLDAAREAGVYYAARNDFGEFVFPKSVLSIPGIGKAADVSNTWFTNFGNVLRLQMFNAGWQSGMDAAQLEKLARTVNLSTGFNPGKPTTVETIATFAPRFFRAQLGLATDALTKTVTKTQQGQYGLDVSRASAGRTIAQLLTAGSALTIGVNEALGQPTDFDPESSNFMRIRGLGRDTSVFGPWDTLARAVTTLATDGPEAASIYLARSKASPAIGRVYDLISGETFRGDKLRFGTPEEIASTAFNMAKASGPISASSLLEGGIPSNPGEVAGAGLGFLGLKSTPLSPYEHLVNTQEDLARTHYNTTWDKLEPYQKDELRKSYDLELDSESDIQKAFDLRGNIERRFNTRQAQLDEDLPIGKDWIDARDELRREQVGAFGQWAEDHPEASAKLRAGKPSNSNEQARMGYYKIFDQSAQEDWTPQETSEHISAYEETLTDDQKAYMSRNIGLKDTPRVKEYKAAQKVLRPYWQLADVVWERYRQRDPNVTQYETLQEYQNALVSQWQDAGIPDARIMSRLQENSINRNAQRATDEVRQRYRVAHRDVDKLLTKWYGYTPISEQR